MSAEVIINSELNELEVLELMVGDHHYAINVAKIKEILSWSHVTPVPNAHPFVEGLFMPRDEMISVIDLRRVLGFEPYGAGEEKGLFIITEFSKLTTGFHIDSVLGIHRVSWEDIQVPDASATAGEDDVASGVVRIDGHLSVVLDFEKIVAQVNPTLSIQTSDLDSYEAKDRSKSPILLAEDSRMLSKLIQECLKKAGYTNLMACENGQEAWEELCSMRDAGKVRDQVHCVITDIEMPKMDGHTLTKYIKDDAAMQQIPVIIFSSMINDVIYKKGEELGADAQLTKPEIEKLVHVVDDLVEKYEEM